jgi:hypothetical protein
MPPPVNTVKAQQQSTRFVLLKFGRIATLFIELCDHSRNQNEQVTSLRILLLVIIGLNQTDRSCCITPSLPDAVLVSLPTELRLRSRLSSLNPCGFITSSRFLSFCLSIFLSSTCAFSLHWYYHYLCFPSFHYFAPLCLLFIATPSPFRFHLRVNGGFEQVFGGMHSACLHSLPYLSEEEQIT